MSKLADPPPNSSGPPPPPPAKKWMLPKQYFFLTLQCFTIKFVVFSRLTVTEIEQSRLDWFPIGNYTKYLTSTNYFAGAPPLMSLKFFKRLYEQKQSRLLPVCTFYSWSRKIDIALNLSVFWQRILIFRKIIILSRNLPAISPDCDLITWLNKQLRETIGEHVWLTQFQKDKRFFWTICLPLKDVRRIYCFTSTRKYIMFMNVSKIFL